MRALQRVRDLPGVGGARRRLEVERADHTLTRTALAEAREGLHEMEGEVDERGLSLEWERGTAGLHARALKEAAQRVDRAVAGLSVDGGLTPDQREGAVAALTRAREDVVAHLDRWWNGRGEFDASRIDEPDAGAARSDDVRYARIDDDDWLGRRGTSAERGADREEAATASEREQQRSGIAM